MSIFQILVPVDLGPGHTQGAGQDLGNVVDLDQNIEDQDLERDQGLVGQGHEEDLDPDPKRGDQSQGKIRCNCI